MKLKKILLADMLQRNDGADQPLKRRSRSNLYRKKHIQVLDKYRNICDSVEMKKQTLFRTLYSHSGKWLLNPVSTDLW